MNNVLNFTVTCAYTGFLKYSLQVVDYAKFVQPRFDKALETLINNTIAEATEVAIKTVKERLLAELEARKQGNSSFKNIHFFCSLFVFKIRSTMKPCYLRARIWFACLGMSGT